MAHAVESMFSVREKPWHYEMTKDVTKIIQEAPTSEEALEAAGLNWVIEGKPVFDVHGNEIKGYKANTRSSDDKVLGIVGSRYNVVQNAEAFAFTDSLIGGQVRYETAGSLWGGKKIWLLAKLPDCYIAGDKTEPYVCFTNTHDGTGAVRVCMTPIRVVCNNTLNAAVTGARRSWSAVHRGNVSAKLEEARETLQLAEQYMKRLDEVADKLANEKFTEGQVVQAVEALVPIDEKATERQKKTALNAREQIITCTLAPDLVKFLNTKWGFVNAVSDYVGHSEPARHTANYEENRWSYIITGHPLLDKAFELVGAKA